MIKIRNIVAILAILVLGACGGTRKIIPDERLARIFCDIYLINAYADMRNIPTDSLNIYEPVFAKYGYTSEDIQFTIGSFAKRKSARLSTDVVARAVEMLGEESRFYARRIAIADTMVQVAREKFAEVVHTDSLIRIRRIRDTALLRIAIPAQTGSYEVAYSYFIDSTDLNLLARTTIYLMNDKGNRSGNSSSERMVRSLREKVSATLSTTGTDRQLVLDLNGYSGDKLTTPNMRIDSLVVTYYPPDSVALVKMARGWLGGDILLDSLFAGYETHIITPAIDSPGVTP